jgi:hypothetical protein
MNTETVMTGFEFIVEDRLERGTIPTEARQYLPYFRDALRGSLEEESTPTAANLNISDDGNLADEPNHETREAFIAPVPGGSYVPDPFFASFNAEIGQPAYYDLAPVESASGLAPGNRNSYNTSASNGVYIPTHFSTSFNTLMEPSGYDQSFLESSASQVIDSADALSSTQYDDPFFAEIENLETLPNIDISMELAAPDNQYPNQEEYPWAQVDWQNIADANYTYPELRPEEPLKRREDHELNEGEEVAD